MREQQYHPEPYWSEVASKIRRRGKSNIIAGDDEPYYRYKRTEFLNLLKELDFSDKMVLEVGCGPGGNLVEIKKLNPKKLIGADISSDMIKLAEENVPGDVEIVKTNGTELPFADNSFDIVLTVTVLQHNTDEAMLKKLISEIGRVSRDKVFIFERIESALKGDDLCMGRPVDYYAEMFKSSGLKHVHTKFINIRVSYFACGFIRKAFNKKDRKEGEPLNLFSIYLQKIALFFTKLLDKIFKSKKDLARLEFRKQ